MSFFMFIIFVLNVIYLIIISYNLILSDDCGQQLAYKNSRRFNNRRLQVLSVGSRRTAPAVKPRSLSQTACPRLSSFLAYVWELQT